MPRLGGLPAFATLALPAFAMLGALALGGDALAQGKPRGKPKPGGPSQGGGAGGPKGPAAGRDAVDPNAPKRAQLPAPLGVEQGSYPTLAPAAVDLWIELGFAHQDEVGGCEQACLAVSGAAEGGFAAVLQDERKGNLGLFLARIGADGRPLGEQAPLSEQVGTARELSPSVAAGPDGAGAFTWMKMAGRSQATLRFYDVEPEGWGEMLPLGSPAYQRVVERDLSAGVPSREARGADAIRATGAPTLADVARADDGRVFVVWREGPRIYLQTYVDGAPSRALLSVDRQITDATGRPRVAVSPDGDALVAFETEKGIALRLLRDADSDRAGASKAVQLATGGPGKLALLRTDPRGGFWLVAQHEERVVLRRIGANGLREGEDVVAAQGALGGFDFAPWRYGAVLLLERAAAGGVRRIELRLLDVDGRPTFLDPIEIPASSRARGAFLAGEGADPERLLVVWNDDRERNGDVYYALLERRAADPDDPTGSGGIGLGPQTRLNDDGASSYQAHASLASNGTRAVLAWDDERASAGHVYCRLLDAPSAGGGGDVGGDGGWRGDELAVDAGPTERDRRLRRPGVAISADGRFLVAWLESAAPRAPFRVRAQAFGADGRALGIPFDVDPGFDAPEHSAPAVAALDGNQGYVVAWLRDEAGPLARRVTLVGELAGEAWRMSDRSIPTAQNVELELLSPRSLVCVWDEEGAPDKRVLTGRLLGPDARVVGRELAFAWSGQGGDLDPELCATGDGGFLMAWTARDGPPRDVFARFFGADGEPTGLPLAISTVQNEQDFCDVARLADGSFVVVFEDDLSGCDHAVARRIAPDRKTLLPVALIDPKVGKHVEVRHAPRIAPLGDGFVSAWNDHSASRGVDVVGRVFGPAFDEGLEPPEPPPFAPAPAPANEKGPAGARRER